MIIIYWILIKFLEATKLRKKSFKIKLLLPIKIYYS
ncbi:hypothetical protein BMETH_39_5 [methanotrophic bacterial endosymbiont of Bathymodiolus sp.]|nr:hypothetical protein BMETH_39_5 [methanotrophic bacterial endosymbiont of Bathymodiolus sp.]